MRLGTLDSTRVSLAHSMSDECIFHREIRVTFNIWHAHPQAIAIRGRVRALARMGLRAIDADLRRYRRCPSTDARLSHMPRGLLSEHGTVEHGLTAVSTASNCTVLPQSSGTVCRRKRATDCIQVDCGRRTFSSSDQPQSSLSDLGAHQHGPLPRARLEAELCHAPSYYHLPST